MTRAVVATGYGGPEFLAFVNEQVGEPGPGEVVVDVRAAGVNLADIKTYRGDFGRDSAKLPLRLGSEASGVVRAVGADAIGPAGPIKVGDEVALYRAVGAYAERILVAATTVVPRPSTLSWTESACLLLTGATAVHLLTATEVADGDTVLIHAAAGGVGVMAVQLARLRGARVIGTASPSRHDFLRELGAEPVAYGTGLADRVRALAPDGVDVALDAIGTDEAVDVSLELVKDRSRIATIAAFGRGVEEGIKVLGGGPGADPGTQIRMDARLELVRLAEDGQLRVFIDRAFPLDDVAAAHGAVVGGHARGKIVLVI